MSTKDEEIRQQAEIFAKVLHIPYDKIVIKRTAISYKRNSEEFGEGFPSLPIPRYIIRNFAQDHLTIRKSLIEEIEELLAGYKIVNKRTNQEDTKDFTSLNAKLSRQISKRYMPREKPVYIDYPDSHTSEEYLEAKRIHGAIIDTMLKMGYALMLDGYTFYELGYEIDPYSWITFNMSQAYVIHRFIIGEQS